MKLTNALMTLSSREWTSFKKYLRMKHREDSDLFDLISRLQKMKSKLDTDDISGQIKEKYFFGLSQKSYLNLYSNIYQELEDWLVYQSIMDNEIEKDVRLVKCLNQRGLYENANQIQKKIEDKFNNIPIKNVEQSQLIYKLYYHQYYSDNPIKYSHPELLKNVLHNYLIFVKNRTILLEIEAHNWGEIKNLDFSSFNNSIADFKIDEHIHDKTSKSLLELKKLLLSPNINSLNSLSKKLIDKQFGVSGEMATLILLYLIRASMVLWNQNKFHETDKILTLFDFGFEHNLLFPEEKIPVIGFINTLSNISALSDNENQAIVLMEKWHTKVAYKDIQSIRQLSLALIAFHFENYGGIIDHLKLNIKFDINEKIRAQGLISIAYSEMGTQYQDILFQHNSNFKRQLKRNKANISLKFYNANKNLIRYIEDNYKSKFSNNSLNIKDYLPIIYRSWVDKKIKQSN